MSKVARSLCTADFHRSYVKKMKAKGLKYLNREKYTKFIQEMGRVYAEEILKNGIVQLPWGLGDVYMKKKIRPGGYTTCITTDKQGVVSKNIIFNEHTDGECKTFFWNSADRKNKKTKMWCFSAERKLKRNMVHELREKRHVYPDFDKMLRKK